VYHFGSVAAVLAATFFFLQLKRFGPAGNGSLWVRLFCAGLTRLSVLIHVKRKRGTRLRFSLLTF